MNRSQNSVSTRACPVSGQLRKMIPVHSRLGAVLRAGILPPALLFKRVRLPSTAKVRIGILLYDAGFFRIFEAGLK